MFKIIGAAMRGSEKKDVASSSVKDGHIFGLVSRQRSMPRATIGFMAQAAIVARHILCCKRLVLANGGE